MPQKSANGLYKCAVILGVTMSPVSMLAAQATENNPRAAPAQLFNESAIVQLLGEAMVEKTSSLFLRAARVGTDVPLEVTLPNGATSYLWQAFLDHLMLSLRGRNLQTPDNYKYIIDASSVTIGRDTIRAVLDVGIRTRCRGAWLADGMSYHLLWIRHGNTDAWNRQKDEMQIAYDSFGCPINPR